MPSASPLFARRHLQAALEWQLRAAIGLGFVLCLSGILMLILRAAGDHEAAFALRGIVWLALAGMVCDGFALLITTALAVIRLLEDRKSDTDKSREETSGS